MMLDEEEDDEEEPNSFDYESEATIANRVVVFQAKLTGVKSPRQRRTKISILVFVLLYIHQIFIMCIVLFAL